MMVAQDALDEMIAKRTARNPNFPRMVAESMRLQDNKKIAQPTSDPEHPRDGVVLSQLDVSASSRKRELA
jgi:hypothetical protein